MPGGNNKSKNNVAVRSHARQPDGVDLSAADAGNVDISPETGSLKPFIYHLCLLLFDPRGSRALQELYNIPRKQTAVR